MSGLHRLHHRDDPQHSQTRHGLRTLDVHVFFHLSATTTSNIGHVEVHAPIAPSLFFALPRQRNGLCPIIVEQICLLPRSCINACALRTSLHDTSRSALL